VKQRTAALSNRKCVNGLIKIYTETSVLAHLQVDRRGPNIFILNTHLETEGSIAMTFSFFPLQTD